MLQITQNELDETFSKMILSASGWRKVFAVSGNQEDSTEIISDADKILCTAIAKVFFDSLDLGAGSKVLLASDARPTGKEICACIYKTLSFLGAKVAYAGICSAPETMAESAMNNYDGFVYVSASHNPVGHNGIKFGKNGGVFGQKIINPIIENLKVLVKDVNSLNTLYNKSENIDVIVDNNLKEQCLNDYTEFVIKTTCPDGNIKPFIDGIKNIKGGIGIVADLNGSARGASIDKAFLPSLGIKTCFINDVPGQIAHAIVPEGKNLETVRELLEKKHAEDPAFILGYMPDNDGDRGNIVYIDKKGKANILAAQEIFALCVASTIEYHSQLGEKNLAVAVNCATSMRINEICEKFGAKMFRGEVGEANVVDLAEDLRQKGYNVPILGEGANGGNITYPAKVRDPMNTLMCLVRLLSKPCSIDEALENLPTYTTTNAYEPEAILHLRTQDFKTLKSIYEKNFPQHWENKKEFLNKNGIFSYFEVQTEGIVERREVGNGNKGGLKICLCDKQDNQIAFIWMRPSGTEPLFRVLADVKGNNLPLHNSLLEWQTEMILKAESEMV